MAFHDWRHASQRPARASIVAHEQERHLDGVGVFLSKKGHGIVVRALDAARGLVDAAPTLVVAWLQADLVHVEVKLVVGDSEDGGE